MDSLMKWLQDKKSIQVDTETEGFFDFRNKVITLQIGTVHDQWVINVGCVDVTPLKHIFESPDVEKVFWNAKFDVKFLKHWYGWEVNRIYDGFLAECVLTTGLDERELSLGACAQNYLGVTLNKAVRGKILKVGLTDEVIKYAAEDVKYLHEIQSLQRTKTAEWELHKVVELENSVVRVFADMELNGMKLDPAAWLEVAKITKDNSKQLHLELDKLVKEEPKLQKFIKPYLQGNLFGESVREIKVEWDSPTQVLLLIRALGLDVDSTGEGVLSKYKNYHPIVAKFLSYKKQAKLVTSFGVDFLKFINPVTGRIHPDTWQILSTGRVSLNEPNLQQIPARSELGKKMRECFIEDEGYSIVGGDYSGCELRIIAQGSKDELWIETFLNNKDLHGEIASKLFNIDIKDVKKYTDFKPDITYRDITKTINFGLAYGMSEYKLASTADITVEKARQIILDYFKAVPAVKSFLEALGQYGVDNGFIRTYRPYRRVRWFEGVDEPDFKREGEIRRASMNTPIQGTNADLVKLALIKVYEEIKKNNYPVKIIITVHDEIRTRCKDEFAEEWKEIMGKIMTDCGKEFVQVVPMTVDCVISKNWSK